MPPVLKSIFIFRTLTPNLYIYIQLQVSPPIFQNYKRKSTSRPSSSGAGAGTGTGGKNSSSTRSSRSEAAGGSKRGHPVKEALSPSVAESIRAVFAAFVWHEGNLE